MDKLTITLTLNNSAALDAIIGALEIYIELEGERSKDPDAGFDETARRRLNAARAVWAEIAG